MAVPRSIQDGSYAIFASMKGELYSLCIPGWDSTYDVTDWCGKSIFARMSWVKSDFSSMTGNPECNVRGTSNAILSLYKNSKYAQFSIASSNNCFPDRVATGAVSGTYSFQPVVGTGKVTSPGYVYEAVLSPVLKSASNGGRKWGAYIDIAWEYSLYEAPEKKAQNDSTLADSTEVPVHAWLQLRGLFGVGCALGVGSTQIGYSTATGGVCFGDGKTSFPAVGISGDVLTSLSTTADEITLLFVKLPSHAWPSKSYFCQIPYFAAMTYCSQTCLAPTSTDATYCTQSDINTLAVCKGVSMWNNPTCSAVCVRQDQACKRQKLAFCKTDSNMFTSQCVQFCKQNPTECETWLPGVCSSKASPDTTDAATQQACGCFWPETVYDNYKADLLKKFPGANIESQRHCYFPQCVSSAAVHASQQDACPNNSYISCLSTVKIDNKGNIVGDVNMQQTNDCQSLIQNNKQTSSKTTTPVAAPAAAPAASSAAASSATAAKNNSGQNTSSSTTTIVAGVVGIVAVVGILLYLSGVFNSKKSTETAT